MNGHKLSSTRQWNRHWQSGEEGGGYPPVPVYPSFKDYVPNIMMFDCHYNRNSDIEPYHQSMLCFLDENRIYFDYFNINLWGINKLIIPAHVELQLKDKIYFNTDDLFNQFPTGFHHINMIQTTLTFFGENIDFYELTFDTNYNFDQRYIEYDFTRANINNIELNAYVMNAVGGADTRTYFDTWRLTGHPTPSPKRTNINFETNVNNLVVRKAGHPIFPNILTGMFVPPYEIASVSATYDLNNLYSNSGGIIINGGTGDIFFRANFMTSVSGEGLPALNGITLDANSFPIRYYDNGYVYYSQYEGIDITGMEYISNFILSSDYDDSVLSKIRIYTTY